MTRISGRLLRLDIDGVDRSDDASKASVGSGPAEGGFLSFAAARLGGARQYILNLTVAQDLAAGSVYREIVDNVGDTIPWVIAPYGNEVPTVAEPHWEGNAIVAEPDGDMIGGEASTDENGALTVDLAWKSTKPVLVTAP